MFGLDLFLHVSLSFSNKFFLGFVFHDVSRAIFVQTLGTRTLLGAPGIATRSKDATRGSWPYY